MAEVIGWTQQDTHYNYLFDIDDTLYTNASYRKAGSERELYELAVELDSGYENVCARIRAKRHELKIVIGRNATLTEIVYAIGITPQQWSALRCRAWQPKEWLTLDQKLCIMIQGLAQANQKYHVACGTNAPVDVGRETLRVLGIPDIFSVFGPESFGVSKPALQFFRGIAAAFDTETDSWISIGDRRATDVEPSIAAGFSGAVVVTGRDDLICLLESLLMSLYQRR